MIKIILCFFLMAFGGSLRAQQQTAVRHADGTVTVEKSGVPEISEPVQTTGRVHHEAILLKDGTQEILRTDESGKIITVTAKAGESVQKKYVDYLIRNNLPCGCGSSSSPETSQTKTATLPADRKK